MARRSIPPAVQDELARALGLKGVVELVVLGGFYEMIAGVIFAFHVALPEGAADPFTQPGRRVFSFSGCRVDKAAGLKTFSVQGLLVFGFTEISSLPGS